MPFFCRHFAASSSLWNIVVIGGGGGGGSRGRAPFSAVEVDRLQQRRTMAAGGGCEDDAVKKKRAIHAIALRAGWSVARRGSATGAGIL